MERQEIVQNCYELICGLPKDEMEMALAEIRALLDAAPQVAEQVKNVLLTPTGTVVVPVMAEPFSALDRFVKNTSKKARVKISYIDDNFRKWFGGLEIGAFAGSTLAYSTLTRNTHDRDILSALGGEAMAEISLSEIWWLMEWQKRGEKGVLLADGRANIFYVRDSTGALRAVIVYYWFGFGWRVYAYELDYYDWGSSRRVFSRNSCEPVMTL